MPCGLHWCSSGGSPCFGLVQLLGLAPMPSHTAAPCLPVACYTPPLRCCAVKMLLGHRVLALLGGPGRPLSLACGSLNFQPSPRVSLAPWWYAWVLLLVWAYCQVPKGWCSACRLPFNATAASLCLCRMQLAVLLGLQLRRPHMRVCTALDNCHTSY